jgi:hypothetical protein
MNRFWNFAAVASLLAFSSAPATAKAKEDVPNTLSQGMVQLMLRVGETSQLQVIDAFGGPNITTIDASGSEVWVYDRHATISSDSSGGFSINMGIGGGFGGALGLGGLGFGSKKSKSETSTRSMTLIIKFDSRKVVSDFKSRSSSF